MTLAGHRADVPALLGALDVFAIASTYEGTPLALFEAMAAGVPIVATRVGGVDDAVSEAEACLVPPEDPAALAGCLADIHSGRQSTEERVTAAMARLREQHGTEQWIERHLELYRGLLNGDQTKTSSTQTC